jgi:hypothetical protein
MFYGFVHFMFRMPLSRINRIVVSGAVFILVLTAILKILSAFGHLPVLSQRDPVLLLSNRTVMLIAGFMELLVAVVLLKVKIPFIRGLIISILGWEFLAYHLVTAWYGINTCPCLGNAWKWLGVSPKAMVVVSVFMAFLLAILGSKLVISAIRLQEPGVH